MADASSLIDLGGGTYQVESGYLQDNYLAIYLIVADGKAAVFDTAHPGSRSRLEAALKELDLAPEAVEYVFVSHLHLDHSGGAGHYAKMLPRARFICNQRAAAHLADPSRVIEAAREIYRESFDSLYGQVLPVPADRIESAEAGATFQLGNRSLEVLAPAGHSFHQICLLDRQADCCHTADAFGHLPELPGAARTMRIISAPSHFAPEKWRDCVQTIAGLGAARISLAHCGLLEQDELPQRAEEVLAELDAFVGFARQSRQSEDCLPELSRLIRARWLSSLWPAGDAPDQCPSIDGDLNLATLGLALWQQKHMPD